MKKVIIKLNNMTIGESEMTFSKIKEAESAGDFCTLKYRSG